MIELWQCKRLTKTILFSHFSPDQLIAFINKFPYLISNHDRGSSIAQQNSQCSSLLVLLDGKLVANMTDSHQRKITVEILQAPSLLAPAFLFGKKPIFPVDIEASESSIILSMSKGTILAMFQQDAKILSSYLDVISSRTQFLSQRLLYLTTKTIQEKIIQYLSHLFAAQNNKKLILPTTITQLSELLAVSRPSLSRGFKGLVEKKIITRKGKNIELLNNEFFKLETD